MAGYGIKVQTDTGHWVWLTETGTARAKNAKGVLKFESEMGAEMERNMLAKANPHANFIVAPFTATKKPAKAASLRDSKHSYSGADQNYYMPGNMQDDLFRTYNSWTEFIESGDSEVDMDYNLMYRWDWNKEGKSYPTAEHVTFYWLQQRRGCVASDTIFVTKDDEPALRAYLQPFAAHMKDLWAPIL
jgi:hypothetical protein